MRGREAAVWLMACLCLPLIWFVPAVATIFWLWMLIDCAVRISRGEQNLIGWLIVVACTHIIGALIYYFFARNPRPPGYY